MAEDAPVDPAKLAEDLKRKARVAEFKPIEDDAFRPGIEVADHEPVETGLVWPDGEPIMRTPNPMGFGRDGEW